MNELMEWLLSGYLVVSWQWHCWPDQLPPEVEVVVHRNVNGQSFWEVVWL